MLTRRRTLAGLLALPLAPVSFGEKGLSWQVRLVRAARKQIGITRAYDPAYVRLDYPNGDVDRARGVCTDVIIRAYRDAFDFDLQSAVHKDMRSHFGNYPANWGLSRPDKNIDHRRVPNLETYFNRQSAELRTRMDYRNWQAGDLVSMRIDGRLPHIAILSDRRTHTGRPLVIHNIGRGAAEEDILGTFSSERRFRFKPPGAL